MLNAAASAIAASVNQKARFHKEPDVKIRAKSRRALERYLKWLPKDGNIFLRPVFIYTEGAPSAAEVMLDWEGRGIGKDVVDHLGTFKLADGTLTKVNQTATCEPDLLADYVQGKKLRDFNITNWREDVAKGFLSPKELVGEGDLETLEQVHEVLGEDVMREGLRVMLAIP